MQELICQFIRPDLLILVPVLFLIGNWLKKSTIRDYKIPFILGTIAIILSNIYILLTINIFSIREILLGLFAGFCQGILIAGASVFLKQLKIQSNKNYK
ncbi:MAG: hypothetical protein J6C55_00385 [Oscillospiraceae bacterium]|nr:hypothetical protein [Oscillospiraceae bacterium]